MNTISAGGTAPAPDIRIASAFLAHFGPPDSSHCFQTFGEGRCEGHRSLARTLHGPLASHAPMLADLNGRGTGVFFVVNEVRLGERRTGPNVTRVRALFADNDNPARQSTVEAETARRGLVASFIVESSPGKRHYYWLIDDCPLASFAPMQRAIAAGLRTDPVVNDLPRVMRLPGFLHHKGMAFLTCEVLGSATGAIYSLADVVTAFPPARAQTEQVAGPHGLPRPYRQGVAGAAPPASEMALRLRASLALHDGRFTPSVFDAVAQTLHGERHAMVRAICARLVPLLARCGHHEADAARRRRRAGVARRRSC